MRIEVKAKLILTIPNPEEKSPAGEITLAAEQHINKIGFFVMPDTAYQSDRKVGIRIHVEDYQEIP